MRVSKLLRQPGRYHDALGLYLVVVNARNASWQFRYQRAGRERFMGLGPTHTVSLKVAREKAQAARLSLLDGVDPLEARQTAKAAAAAEAAKALTFRDAAAHYYEQHAAKWDNRKSAEQFVSSLRKYAFDLIGALPVAAIDTPLVLKVLEQPVEATLGYDAGQLWATRPTTADRVRNRIESVLDWATVRGHRSGDNPARWRGHLDQVLPARRQLARPEHHAAMPYAEVPAFMAELATHKSVAAVALRFLILTAARTGEVNGARWSEIDFETATWTVPAERMKARKEHKVPLSEQALELLRSVYAEAGNDYVFIGARAGAALSETAMATMLRRMGSKITVHGFRASFRSWAAERTAYPREVAEMALAHSIGDAVERAYQRSSLFDHRRRLMAEWSSYCLAPPVAGEVVRLRGAR
jgi:integrase